MVTDLRLEPKKVGDPKLCVYVEQCVLNYLLKYNRRCISNKNAFT